MNAKSSIIAVFLLCITSTSAYAELRNGMDADVVIGQPNFVSGSANQGGSVRANTLRGTYGVSSDGKRLFVADFDNSRVLIYNSIPVTNNASADVVIGQVDFVTVTVATSQSNMRLPVDVCTDGKRLFVSDRSDARVLIWNSIPTINYAPADVVLGQTSFGTRTAGTTQSKFNIPRGIATDGKRLFVADNNNHRVLIWNSSPTTNGAPADVVLGQTDFTTATSGTTQSKFNAPWAIATDGKRLFVADYSNHRVLIWNSIPTTNNAPADVVLGQTDFTTATSGTTQSKFNLPRSVATDGKRLFVADISNNRVLIWNSIPTTNNAPADIVLGQQDFTSSGPGTTRNKFDNPGFVFTDGKRLFVSEYNNDRVLIFNIGSSSIELGPQFEQGKAVLGKVFNDLNANGRQDEDEEGIEGVKVASDTGIYAITDEDGKYHFPYIETGQRLLKIDPVTLPERAVLTTDNPYKVTVTKGILTKVSFGVKLPAGINEPADEKTDQPLLKVSISQDPVLLKPKLAVLAVRDKDNIVFEITCNYFLFIERSKLIIYDTSYQPIKTIELPKPIPSKYTLPISELPNNPITQQRNNAITYYYQLFVYDKKGNEDRTGVGSFEIEN